MSYIFSKIYQILGFDKKIKLHRFIYYINLSFINCLTVQRNRGEWRDNWPTKFDTANPPQLIPNPCATQDSSDLWLLRVGRVGHAPTPFESETHPTCVCVCVYTGEKEIHRKEIRIASHKFSSQRQPRFLVLIFKAHAAIYYSTTVRICIFSPRILEPPPCLGRFEARLTQILFELPWFTATTRVLQILLSCMETRERDLRGQWIFVVGKEKNYYFESNLFFLNRIRRKYVSRLEKYWF